MPFALRRLQRASRKYRRVEERVHAAVLRRRAAMPTKCVPPEFAAAH